MYTSQDTKDRIKDVCRQRGINMESMLVDCGLGVNAIRQINDKKGMASYSLAKIADYLDVSVDYLLGRSDFLTPPPDDLLKMVDAVDNLEELLRVLDLVNKKLQKYVLDKSRPTDENL